MQELYNLIKEYTGIDINTLEELGALSSEDIAWGAQDVFNIGPADMDTGLYQHFSLELFQTLSPHMFNPLMESKTRGNIYSSLMPSIKRPGKGTGFAGSYAPSPYMDAREQFRNKQVENISGVLSAQQDARQLAISGVQDWGKTSRQLLGT